METDVFEMTTGTETIFFEQYKILDLYQLSISCIQACHERSKYIEEKLNLTRLLFFAVQNRMYSTIQNATQETYISVFSQSEKKALSLGTVGKMLYVM